MARVVDLTCADDDDAQSTSTTKSGSKSGYTTPSADKSTSGIFNINFIEVIIPYLTVLNLFIIK